MTRKAAEGIPLFSALILEIASYFSNPLAEANEKSQTNSATSFILRNARRRVVRERGRYTLSLLLSSLAVSIVYCATDQNVTFLITVLALLILCVNTFGFAMSAERFILPYRLVVLIISIAVILFEIDPVLAIVHLFGLS